VFERFTDRARRVLVLAQEEACNLNHNFVGTEHILLGLIHEGEGVAAKALESLGISLEAVREKVEETIGPAGSANTGSPPLTPRAKKVLELSLREALQLGHDYIGTEHMLLGLVREGEGAGAQVLVSLGADLSRVHDQVIDLVVGTPPGQGDARLTSLERGRSEDRLVAAAAPGAGRGPRCPACRGPLEGHVGYRVLRVPHLTHSGPAVEEARPAGEDGPAGEDRASGADLDVVFVYCLRCGVMAAHAPAGEIGSSGRSETTAPPG